MMPENPLRRLTVWKALLIVILSFGLFATIVRYAQGLGAATNLSDAFPWGLWIGFDVLVGVGLAAGGFVIAATVHVFRMERYEAIARPTILTAFLGYSLVVVALLFDLGQPWRIWHPVVMWNPHSVMFEIGWCVMLYTTVLALEFSPLVFERFKLERPLKVIRAIYVPLVIVGVLLSTLHQSSLGTLYVIAPDKLHGLWYSPLLPLFFFISAIAGGLAMTIFESFLSYRAFGKRLEPDLLRGLGRVAVVVLALYAVWRLQDLAMRGNLGLVFQITPESVLFLGEIGLGVFLPMVLFATPRVRRNENGLFLAATLTIMGFIVNRLNVAITGMAASSGVFYVPSWMELAVTTSIVAAGFALFAVAVRYLPVFPKGDLEASQPRDRVPVLPVRRPLFGKGVLLALWSLFVVGLVATAFSMARNGNGREPRAESRGWLQNNFARAELSLPAGYTFPSAEESPGPVTFNHETHVDPDDPRCGVCHREMFKITAPVSSHRGELSYERIHEQDLCGSCHNGQEAFSIADDCNYCHEM